MIDKAWEQFVSSGKITDYLAYCSCEESTSGKREAACYEQGKNTESTCRQESYKGSRG